MGIRFRYSVYENMVYSGSYEQIIKDLRDLERPIMMEFIYSYTLMKMGDLDKALKNILKVYPTIEALNFKTLFTIILAELYAMKNMTEEGEKLLDSLKEHVQHLSQPENLDLNNRLIFIQYNICLASIRRKQGRPEKALPLLNAALGIIDDELYTGKKFHVGALLNELGTVYHDLGKLQSAEQYWLDALKVKEAIGNEFEMAKTCNNLGLIHVEMGEIFEAEEYFLRASELTFKKDLYTLSIVYNNLGYLNEQKNDLDNALIYYELSLALAQKFGSEPDVNNVLINIAKVYYKRHEYRQATEMFDSVMQKESLYTIGRVYSECLLYQIILSYNDGDFTSAQFYFEDLESIAISTSLTSIQHRLYLAEIILTLFSKRVTAMARALSLVKKFLNLENVSHEHKILAFRYYMDILLQELKMTDGDKEVFDELETVLTQLRDIATLHGNYALLIQTMLIQSKLFYIFGDVMRAKEIIKSAEDIVVQKGLTALSGQVNEELQSLDDEIERWDNLLTNHPEIAKNMKEERMLTYLKSVARNFVS